VLVLFLTTGVDFTDQLALANGSGTTCQSGITNVPRPTFARANFRLPKRSNAELIVDREYWDGQARIWWPSSPQFH